MEGLGQKLKNLRGKRYTQKEVSEATGIPISTLAAYENSLRQPALDNLRTLAKFYGVSPGYLLEDNETSSYPIPHELWEIYHEVTQRPNLKLLFKEGTGLTEEDVVLICQLIATIKKKPVS
ncbi:MAG: helix-turn-helix domain-containing protein [Thermincolia bacterium]